MKRIYLYLVKTTSPRDIFLEIEATHIHSQKGFLGNFELVKTVHLRADALKKRITRKEGFLNPEGMP